MASDMALNADAVIALMTRFGVDVRETALAADRTEETINGWRSGRSQAPDYLEYTLRAWKARLAPLTTAQMMNMESLTVASMLGVHPGVARYWLLTSSFPVAARRAMASFKIPSDRLTRAERQHLTRIECANYYRAGSGYRARPTIGKRLPMMKFKTVTDLKSRGLVIEGDRRNLMITPAARKLLYREG